MNLRGFLIMSILFKSLSTFAGEAPLVSCETDPLMAPHYTIAIYERTHAREGEYQLMVQKRDSASEPFSIMVQGKAQGWIRGHHFDVRTLDGQAGAATSLQATNEEALGILNVGSMDDDLICRFKD